MAVVFTKFLFTQLNFFGIDENNISKQIFNHFLQKVIATITAKLQSLLLRTDGIWAQY